MSPVASEVIALNQVKDEAFASGAMGKGIAVYPKVGEIVALEDCIVTVLYPTLHAMGLKLDNGIELLIHIGIDTVNLQGKYFQSYVRAGQHITKGIKFVSFEIDKIKQQFDLTTSIIVVNSDQYKHIEYCQQAQVSVTDNLLVIHV